ncbi:metallophosphoesterase [Polyangium aurulentum]|uniref:metallophosphoesterase n=1 Tax=Polyangium aurulentum TaxID=2567896 RepID=UPI0020104305|nr:metallophosphoesterase [Polyangium aurulentum]UQA59544.1 metallophosphoesterase [Polyangium aurulentum]
MDSKPFTVHDATASVPFADLSDLRVREAPQIVSAQPLPRPETPAKSMVDTAARPAFQMQRPRGQRHLRFAPLAASLAIAFASAPAASAEIRKGPFLQALGQTGVTVKLELATPEAATVEIEGPGGFKASRASESAKRFHALRVDGLSPASTYTYRVTAGGAQSAPAQFTTAPADNRPFRFVVYGDSRSDPSTHAAVARMIESAPGDFFVHTGDMVYDGADEEEWQELFTIERKLLANRCAFVAIGNHELTSPDPKGQITFLRYFAATENDGRERPHLYGSFRWSNTRFFLLNAMDTWTGDEKEWLRAELAAALDEPGLQHRVAVLHHGPFSSGRHGGNVRLKKQGIVDLMRDHKVDLLFAGHDHVYERGEGQGIKYIVSGGAGAPLYRRENSAPETQAFEATHHFLEVAVDGEKVDVVARRASGAVIEQCGFKGTESWSCKTGDAKAAPKPPAAAAGSSSSCACQVPGGSSSLPGWPLGLAASLVLALRRVLRRTSEVDA